MIHLVTLNPAIDLFFDLQAPSNGKIGKIDGARAEAGGKALNISRFLKAYKVPHLVWLGAGGGNDASNLFYRALLKKEKLKVRFLGSEGPVRFNLVTFQKKHGAKFNHPGFEADITYFAKLLKEVKKGDLLVLTGRLPQGANDSLYASWIEAFNRKGVRTFIDTSGPALLAALKAKPWFFKVNGHEMSEAIGQKLSGTNDIKKFVSKNWLRNGLGHGAITDGANGAILWRYPEKYFVQTPRIPSSLVIGAGDGFLAGYLAGIHLHKNVKQAALLAGAFGSVVAEHGIQGFNKALVQRALKRVRLRKLV